MCSGLHSQCAGWELAAVRGMKSAASHSQTAPSRSPVLGTEHRDGGKVPSWGHQGSAKEWPRCSPAKHCYHKLWSSIQRLWIWPIREWPLQLSSWLTQSFALGEAEHSLQSGGVHIKRCLQSGVENLIAVDFGSAPRSWRLRFPHFKAVDLRGLISYTVISFKCTHLFPG